MKRKTKIYATEDMQIIKKKTVTIDTNRSGWHFKLKEMKILEMKQVLGEGRGRVGCVSCYFVCGHVLNI